MKKNSLDIIFSCNKQYIQPLLSIINSILTNTDSNNKLTFNIVCDDSKFFIDKLEILKTIHKSYNYSFKCVTLLDSLDDNEVEYLKKYSYSPDEHTSSIYNFSRFWFHKLFPELDYIIYLDIDMIIEGDIYELANFSFNKECFFAAVCGPWFFSHSKQVNLQYKIKLMKFKKTILNRYNIKNDDLAFNAGLYVTSLDFWRKNNKLDEIKNILKERYENKNLYKLGTQPPLNLIFLNNMIKIEDLNWMVSSLGEYKVSNFAIESITSGKAKCLHWTGPKKPWKSDRFPEIYNKYVIKS